MSTPPDARLWIPSVLRGDFLPTASQLGALRLHIMRAPFITETSLLIHSERRIADQQWRRGITADQYLGNLRSAVEVADHLLLYERHGGAMAAAVARTEAVVEESNRGSRTLPWLIVVYSVDRDRIITGYQFSGLDALAIPEAAFWFS